MGPPGVGKGTQARQIAKRLGVPHVSTGDMLREAIQEASALGRRVRPYLEAGQLVPDDLMEELIADRLGREDAERGFVLDGFPRTLEQVTALDRVLGRLGVTLDRAVALGALEHELVRRLSGRRVCPGCGRVYHLESRPPAAPGVCDGCGSALVQRQDDQEDVVRHRLAVYTEQTMPVILAYRDRGLLHDVDGAGEVDAVFGSVMKGLEDA